jgi:hypothetical protein
MTLASWKRTHDETMRDVARLSRHLCAVVDGVVHDTFDPSRDGTRCVYGYWKEG